MKLFSNSDNFFKKISEEIKRILSLISFSQENTLLILGGLTGLLVGVGAIIFHEAIHFMKWLSFDALSENLGINNLLSVDDILSAIILILLPALGGFIVGLLAHYFEKGEEGEGIPNVIKAVATKGGIIKGSIAIKKIFGAAVSIGSGGAGGKEGPVVQIGASISSYFGQFFSLSPDKLKILVGCGAAAGLSAAFNAPLGGALFAMEIILRTFKATTFSPILISSVFATALSRGFLGKKTIFNIPNYSMVSYTELGFYIILGILCGLAAVYFVKTFYYINDFWAARKKIPKLYKPAIGGLMVGVIGLFLPGIYGWSYDYINFALDNSLSILLLFLLLVFKPIATGLTLGSGGNGGTFAPSMFTGAMIGGLFGNFMNFLFPSITAHPGAYALVGMGAVVAGTTQGSLTAMIMVFEMSDNYKIILPLMLTIIISRTLAKSILKGDLYSLSFERKGIEIDIYGRKTSILKRLKVQELLEKYDDYIFEHYTFSKILEILRVSKFNTLIVMNSKNNIVGQVSFKDIREVLIDDDSREISEFLIAKDFMTKGFNDVDTEYNCEDVLKILESRDYDYLPVFDRHKNQFVGIISRNNILDRYQKEIFLQQSNEEMAV